MNESSDKKQERQMAEARVQWERIVVAIASEFRVYGPLARCEKVQNGETAIEEMKAPARARATWPSSEDRG